MAGVRRMGGYRWAQPAMRPVPKRLIKIGGNQHNALVWLCEVAKDVDDWIWWRAASPRLSQSVYQTALDGLVHRGCVERRHGGELRVTPEGFWQFLRAKERSHAS